MAPSYIEANRIWAGTDDGLIHVTADDGLHWTDVTLPPLTPWAKVSLIYVAAVGEELVFRLLLLSVLTATRGMGYD